MRDRAECPYGVPAASVDDGGLRSRLVGESRWHLFATLRGEAGIYSVQPPSVNRHVSDAPGKSRGSGKKGSAPWDTSQNGRTITMMTMTITSSVGTSLAIR